MRGQLSSRVDPPQQGDLAGITKEISSDLSAFKHG
jgi:hypothetical protein